MSKYLIINVCIILIPLLFSFEGRLKFYKKFTSVIFAALPVASIYIIWDSIASARGDWSFNGNLISGHLLFRLPVEEILFFFTVSFSIIFIFETVKYFVKRKNIIIKNYYFTAGIILLIALAVIFSGRIYTFTVLIFSAASVSAVLLLFPALLHSNIYWWTIGISYVPFFIVNYILTSLPVVIYNPEAIIGIRVKTIPVEDLFYSFSMITFLLLFYHISETKRILKIK